MKELIENNNFIKLDYVAFSMDLSSLQELILP